MAERDEILDHDYDGIQEFDNDLPRWWVWMFWLTIVFGVFYVGYYHYGPGNLQYEDLAEDMEALERIRSASKTENVKVEFSEEQMLALVEDPLIIAKGKEIYLAKCASCHFADGKGLVGPNLTDDYWVHGGKILDIKLIIEDGVPDKGMLAWKTILPDEDIKALTAFVWTLHGSNPPNPKKSEGELVPR